MSISQKEKTVALWDELIEYEKNTKMTGEERKVLREWVLDGNSVHDNGSMSSTEHGIPSDFLDVYRYEEEIRHDLEKLSEQEQKNYLARLQGTDTIDNLREDLDDLHLRSLIYEYVLRDNGLLEVAEFKIKQAKSETKERNQQFREWRSSHPEEELPFE
jgi:hypothetical protein